MLTSSKLILATTAAITVILGACATADQNPYYKYSSKYPSQTSSGQVSGTPSPQELQPPTTSYASTTHNQNSYVTDAGYPAPSGTVFSDSATSAAGYPHTNIQTYGTDQTHSQSYGYVQSASTGTSVSTPNVVGSAMIETGGQNAGANGYLMQHDSVYGYDVSTAAGAQTASIAVQQAPLTIEPLANQTYAAVPYTAPITQIAAGPIAFDPITSAPTTSNMALGQPSVQGIRYIVQEDDTVYSLSRKTCSTVERIKEMNGLDEAFLIKAGGVLQLPASNC